MIDILFLVAGLVLLVIGGDILVRGAVSIATKFSIPPLIIGLTIVSLGTSAPELFISVDAALLGLGGLAVGNVVGSNIANILLVLGVPALIATTGCSTEGINRNILIMLGFTVVFMLMLYLEPLQWYHGIILVSLLALFLYDQYTSAKAGGTSVLLEEDADDPIDDPMWKSVLFLVIGIVLLPLGAHLTVIGAKEIASALGISDAVIGLTVVAIGTSLPELAASTMAVIRGNSNVAIGNVVGSNIFNIAAIMGITALIVPVVPGDHIVHFDMWVMLGTSVILMLIVNYLKEITFKTGLAMLIGYGIYLWAAFL